MEVLLEGGTVLHRGPLGSGKSCFFFKGWAVPCPIYAG